MGWWAKLSITRCAAVERLSKRVREWDRGRRLKTSLDYKMHREPLILALANPIVQKAVQMDANG
jgi:hypothetical protein